MPDEPGDTAEPVQPPPIPAAGTVPPGPDQAGVGVLAEPRGCVRCAYNLQGLAIAGKCPECGTLVTDSLKGILLQHADRVYLEKVRSGLSLVLNSILLTVALTVVIFAIAIGGGPRPGAGAGLNTVMEGIMLIPAAIGIVGYWRYSEPDLGFIGQEKPDSARKILRNAVLVTAGLGLAGWVVGIAGGGSATHASPLGVAAVALAALSTIAWCVQFICVLRYSRWMARRVPDAFVVQRCGTYQWLLPVLYVVGALCVGLGPLVALVLYWNLLDRVRKHVRAILATGVPAALPKMV